MPRHIIVPSVLALLLASCGTVSDPEPTDAALLASGIDRELARWRAADVSEVRYELDVTLTAGADLFGGACRIHFDLAETPHELILDFRGHDITGLTVNDVDPETTVWRRQANHLVIAGRHLRRGRNRVSIDYTAGVGGAGEGLIRSRDKDDGGEYVYTLNVPADGHAVFPCFDQPDIKGRFRLTVTAPADWRVVSNAPETDATPVGDSMRHTFDETEPLSTYVFAFAAGPFAEIVQDDGRRRLRFYGRRSQRALLEKHAPAIFHLHRTALAWLEEYFAVPYPFKKLDFLCVPDFPFGGMEHAGAIFYGETPMLFRSEVTRLQEARRADLISHEVAHMWFGDLVTMPWFDDVWLKEGFATFMAHKVLEATFTGVDHERNFFLRNVPAALDTDMTAGARPIRQPLQNLADAKSQYGPIIYRKGPAVLRQLEHMIGPDTFRRAVRGFLKRYSFDSAAWPALREAFETAWREDGAADADLGAWSEAWIESAGVPEVTVSVDAENFVLRQRALDGSDRRWPLGLKLVAFDGDGAETTADVVDARAECACAHSMSSKPSWGFANHGGHGYVLAALDEESRAAVVEGFKDIRNDLLRAMLWESLWWEVLEARQAPVDWLAFALEHAWQEDDQRLVQLITGRMATCLRRYLSESQRAFWAPRVEAFLVTRMNDTGLDKGLRLLAFRGLFGAVHSDEGCGRLISLIEGTDVPDGITISHRDRWSMVTRLMLLGHPEADRLLALMKEKDPGDEGQRRAFAVECARRDAEHKRELFRRFRHDESIPERQVQDGAKILFAEEHAELAREHLAAALEQLVWIKANRKIFFLADWVNAAVRGQLRAEDVEVVEDYVDEDSTPEDVRKKVKVALDHLKRTVAIREKHAK